MDCFINQIRGACSSIFCAVGLLFVSASVVSVSGCSTDADQTPAAETTPKQTVVNPNNIAANETVAYNQTPVIDNSIVLGLDADMTSGSAISGEAIRRGIVLAMQEINDQGGVLGRPLELVIRDHRGNPARGVDNIEEFAKMDRLAAVVGGIHTPVALQELESIHKHKIVYLGPWAAGTPIVANNYSPNFVYRVSVRDEYAGGFLVRQALQKGHQEIGLLLEQTGWGRSNEKAIKDALATHNMKPAGVEWFHWGIKNLDEHVDRLVDAGADTIILVCNPLEGVVAVKSMAKRSPSQRLTIISHWGISAGDFFRQAAAELAKVDVVFLQTYSFLKPTQPERASQFVAQYCQRFDDCSGAKEIFAPVGTAHAYELVHLFRQAIEKAGTTDRIAIRDAMEQIDKHEGLIRNYAPPFTVNRHDALSADDFCLARYADDGAIVPISD